MSSLFLHKQFVHLNLYYKYWNICTRQFFRNQSEQNVPFISEHLKEFYVFYLVGWNSTMGPTILLKVYIILIMKRFSGLKQKSSEQWNLSSSLKSKYYKKELCNDIYLNRLTSALANDFVLSNTVRIEPGVSRYPGHSAVFPVSVIVRFTCMPLYIVRFLLSGNRPEHPVIVSIYHA